MSSFIIGFSAAIGLIISGYLVGYRKWSFLIAGYNTSSKEEKAKYDEDALCQAVGRFLFLLGGITLISSLGALLEIPTIIYVGSILFGVTAIGFLIYANTGNRYKK